MKKLFAALALGSVFALSLATAAQAQNNPLITVDERGNGTLQFTGGPSFPTGGVLAPDPGPGGRPLALTYSLLGPPGLTAGDLLILDPVTFALSDVIRFNAANTAGSGNPAELVFYSLDNFGQLADTGGPSALYANNIARFESAAGDVFFTPATGDPGFIPGFGVTYHVISDATAPTPEFGSVFSLGGLLAAGGAGLYVRRRRSARVKSEAK